MIVWRNNSELKMVRNLNLFSKHLIAFLWNFPTKWKKASLTSDLCLPMTACSLERIFQCFTQSAWKMSQGMKKLVEGLCRQLQLLVRKCFELLHQNQIIFFISCPMFCCRPEQRAEVAGDRVNMCCKEIKMSKSESGHAVNHSQLSAWRLDRDNCCYLSHTSVLFCFQPHSIQWH